MVDVIESLKGLLSSTSGTSSIRLMNTVKGISCCSSTQFRAECLVSTSDEVASDVSSPLTELSSLDEDGLSSSPAVEMANGDFDEHAAAQVNGPPLPTMLIVSCDAYRFSLVSPPKGHHLMPLDSLTCRGNKLIVLFKRNAIHLPMVFLPRTRLGGLGK
jgi:hypothetical protein